MMGTQGMASDWRERHPFKIGDLVRPRGNFDPKAVARVAMRGESDLGLWIAFERIPYEYSVNDFEAHVAATAEVA